MSVIEARSLRVPHSPELVEDVEALLNQREQEGVFRETEKSLGLLLALGAALLSPPTPRRKR